MIRSSVALLLCVVSLAAFSSAATQPFDYPGADHSVVHVLATGCPTYTSRSATGFAWGPDHKIVTAWHAVGGCSAIDLHSDFVIANSQDWHAHVDKVLRKADLALLVVDGSPGFPSLVAASTAAKSGDGVHVLGYPEQALAASGRDIAVGYSGRNLTDLVGPDVANAIASSGTPAADVQIIYVPALVNGLSGAPVMNDKGEVVGVGDGGLEGGAYGINWAVVPTYLTELAASTEDVVKATTQLGDARHFARDFAAGTVSGHLNCGGYDLSQLPSVTIAQAMYGTDNPLGLSQLQTALYIDSTAKFDVYQDPKSGATITVPDGSTISSTTSGCDAAVPNSHVVISIKFATVSGTSVQQINNLAMQFQAKYVNGPPWTVIPNWTQPTTPRFDGLLVQRITFEKPPSGFGITPEMYFETFATKRTMMVMASAYDSRSPWGDPMQVAQCAGSGFSSDSCISVGKAVKAWGSAVIAVHLATFPPG